MSDTPDKKATDDADSATDDTEAGAEDSEAVADDAEAVADDAEAVAGGDVPSAVPHVPTDSDAELIDHMEVEPDFPPTRSLAGWVVGMAILVVLLVVGVVQFYELLAAEEMAGKSNIEHTQLEATRARDGQRLTNIEEAMSQVADNPALLGPVAYPDDDEAEGTGGAPEDTTPEQGQAPDDATVRPADSAATADAAAEAAGVIEAAVTPRRQEGTGQPVPDVAEPEGTGIPPEEGTGADTATEP